MMKNNSIFWFEKCYRIFKQISLHSDYTRLVIRFSNITTPLKMAGSSYNLEITKLSALSFQI